MKKGQVKYSSNGEFMRAAFDLYMRGYPAIKIASEMGKEYPGLCRQTVQKIIINYGWKNQRHEYLQWQCSKKDDKNNYLKELKNVAERLYNIINGKSKEEATQRHFAQYLKALEMIGKLSGWETGHDEKNILATDLDMRNFLEVLEQDEVIGRNLKKRKRIISREFEKKRHDQETNR